LKTQCPTEYPNIESSHGSVFVKSGGMWVIARGLKERNPFTQWMVRQATNIRLIYMPTCAV